MAARIPSRLRRRLQEAAPDWEIDLTRSNHIRLRHPSGAVVIAALSASDHRSWANTVAHIRRAERAAKAGGALH
jgi:hypothetical protein